MSEKDFFTIFETKQPSLLPLTWFEILVILFCGALAFLSVRFLIPCLYGDYKENGLQSFIRKKLNIILLCVLFLFVSFTVLPLVGVFNSAVEKHKLYNSYVSGACNYVEGVIEDFHPMPVERHDSERFSVNGVEFSYAGYKNGYYYAPEINGKYLKEGLYVRIWYVNDDHDGAFTDSYILRIDIYYPK